MGLVINPVGYRIGYSQYWVDSWYLHRMYYPVFVHKSLEMKLLLEYCLRRKKWRKSFWVYSHFTFYYFNDKFHINVFFYDGIPENIFSNHAGKFKFRAWRNLRLQSGFRKRQILDKHHFATRWWLFCYLLNFKIEKFRYEELERFVKPKVMKKIESLKKQYGKNWVAKEELNMQKFLTANNFFNKYNKLGMVYFNRLFKLYQSRFLKDSFDKIINNTQSYYFKKKYNKLKKIVRSYKSMFFFFSYIDKLFRHIPMYPFKFFNRKSMKYQVKIYCLYFVFRPYWIQMSKFYEILFLYINVDSKISVYYLSNPHLSAQYISRYIMTTFKYKFDYKDTLTPIKKTLNRILFVKTWTNTKKTKFDIWNRYIDIFDRYLNNRKNLYRSLFVMYNLKLFNKLKMVEYLKKIKNLKKYKLKYVNNKKLKFRKFSVSNFIKNLRYIRNNFVLINRCERIFAEYSLYKLIKKKPYFIKKYKLENRKFFLIKKNKFILIKNSKIIYLNKLFFFYRKFMLQLFKNKIINKFKKYYQKFFYFKEQKYIFLPIKFLIRKNRLNYKLKNIVNLFYKFKSKYNPVRRKIYKIRRLYYRFKYLKLKKLSLIRTFLIKIFLILNKSNYSYKLDNGFYYNYMNSFDKSIAFSSLNKLQNFWSKKRSREDYTEFFSLSWFKNIDFIFVDTDYKWNPKIFKLFFIKLKKMNYFAKNKIRYKIKLRNIKINIKNNLYFKYINKCINLKFKAYNLIKNKIIYFFLNYGKKFFVEVIKKVKKLLKWIEIKRKLTKEENKKKFISERNKRRKRVSKMLKRRRLNEKKIVKKNIVIYEKNSIKNIFRILFGALSIKHVYKKKYIYFFKEISNFFLFKYNISSELFEFKSYFHKNNNILNLNNFNDKFIFFSLLEPKINVFNNYYNDNIAKFRQKDKIFLNYLKNRIQLLKFFVKKVKKGRIKRNKGKILRFLDNILLTKEKKDKKLAAMNKLRILYVRFFTYKFKKYFLRRKIVSIKKFSNKLIKKIIVINKKIENFKILLKKGKLVILKRDNLKVLEKKIDKNDLRFMEKNKNLQYSKKHFSTRKDKFELERKKSFEKNKFIIKEKDKLELKNMLNAIKNLLEDTKNKDKIEKNKFEKKEKINQIIKKVNPSISKEDLIINAIKKNTLFNKNKMKENNISLKKKNIYKFRRKIKILKKYLKYLIFKKVNLILRLRKLKLKKMKLLKMLIFFLKKQFELYTILLNLKKRSKKRNISSNFFKKFNKKIKKKNRLKKKLYYYQRHMLFRQFKAKKIKLMKKFKRGYFVIFIRSFIDNYSKNYLPFVFNLDLYENYLQRLFNLPLIKYQIIPKEVKKTNLKVTPLINKFRKLKYLQGDKINVLYGYKFHFSGRFTRKQKAASWWYTKGSVPASSMSYDVDYGYFTMTLRYSACTLKVWLYKNKKISPKYGIKMV